MSLKVITVTSQPERAKPLTDSLEKFGWDWVCAVVEWKGFGTKLITVYEYLKENPEVDRFIFCDAHDVVALAGPDEFEEKIIGQPDMIFNAERGCWPAPVQHFEYLYSKFSHGFNYLNSGVYYCASKLFIEIFERCPVNYETDDQWWASMVFLFGRWHITIDREQKVFNCHSFIRDGDYTYNNNRVQILGNEPIFIHFNGQTLDEKFNELIKL